MKTTIRTIVAGAAALAFSALTALAFPPVGQPAPDFSLKDATGKEHALKQYRGKVVVLEWNNPECPFVQKHYQKEGNLPSLQKSATADGVVWLTINSGHPGAQGVYDRAQLQRWMEKTGAAPTAYLHDAEGKVGKSYDARHTPTLYVIDAQGHLAYAGGIDSIPSSEVADIPKATNYVSAALADLKAGRPVAKAVTRAYGCGVKY